MVEACIDLGCKSEDLGSPMGLLLCKYFVIEDTA